jgi:ubiquinone/menaquinone biosynthesis C-methylase UbiE
MTEMRQEPWPSRSALLEMAGAYRGPCVLGAAAELDVWSVLGDQQLTAEEIAGRLRADLRATRMLLDALAALRVLAKSEEHYSVPAELRPLLTAGTPQSILPMIHHGMNILRNWTQLAWVVKAGIAPPRQASIRGFDADRAAFIAAMHVVSGPVADDVVAKLGPLEFRHLLDVGGASGTWTIAFLRAAGGARATIFDLPDAIHQARDRFAGTELAHRVAFAAGDFYRDELPPGADFAWLSAIIHQHARDDSRALFAKVFRALEAGGRIGIRDIVMEPCRTRPVVGAMFAINMLVNTDRGGTFTFAEIAEDLQAAGFRDPELRVRSDEMSSVVIARKPR